MRDAWGLAVQASHLLCAAAALALAVWIVGARRGVGLANRPAAAALAATSAWAAAAALLGPVHAGTAALLGLAYLGWLWTLFRLFAHDERDKNVGPVRPVVLVLACVELLQLALLAVVYRNADVAAVQVAVGRFAVIASLLFCTGALVLVHNLYAGASREARETLRWPAAALGAMWLYELNLATIAYLTDRPPQELASLRGTAMLAAVALMALGAMRSQEARRFRPSRSFTFQSFSLLIIGGYLLVMLVVVRGLSYAGSRPTQVVQTGFVAAAIAAGLGVLLSRRLRSQLRVTLSKHLFQHRYDYRAEWLRFTQTMGSEPASAAPLRERIVQAVADITDSPAGLLLTLRDEGGLALGARWQWPQIEVPAEALSADGARFFEASQFIVDLDDLRARRTDGIPAAAHAEWLLAQEDAWAMVPLLHYDRLVGVVVLARPPVARRLDWEDFDLLRVVGRQLASYLAEQASQDALGDAQRFDEFNRRIAFVMHDIKNLASQLSLLARNAEKHADKPEFRADMLLTLRNSTDKLQALLARLGRYGGHADSVQPVATQDLLTAVATRYAPTHQVVVIARPSCTVHADREGLEQALVHLVQNAIEASPADAPVFLDLRCSETHAVIEVIDAGSGMSPEFIRTRLFKPFHSSKPGGFGIGAFEARELVRAMGGRLEVQSRERLGTRFLLTLPRADCRSLTASLHSPPSEVA